MALALATSNNLPRQLTSFVGRQREIEDVRRLFEATRLLTLRGAGGSGKTRLAVEVASLLASGYPDGVWFVDLARLSDPALLPHLVASTLDISEQAGRDITETLSEQLEECMLLLVLDNCEHLVEACASLAHTLLHACPDLRVLATSREALGLPGEIAWYVPPLSLPDLDEQAPPGSLAGYEAVQLFVDRARSKRSDFALTPFNAAHVALLCRHLDGMPLALELAAARVNVLSVEQLVDRLSERFKLLTSGSQSALPRHQTLRALVDWSYDLLSEQERTLLRRLSAFAGGFTLEGAEAVCDLGIDSFEMLDLLSRLVDKSLVIMEEQGGEARYRMLETIRQYAWEKLQASEEVEATRTRHLEWFLRIAEEADPQMRGVQQAEWSARLETEHDNFRAALAWSQESGTGSGSAANALMGLRLSGALFRFWSRRGYFSEGRGWLKSALEQATAHPAGHVPHSVVARALYGMGVLAWIEGDLPASRPFLERAVALCREGGERWGAAYSLTYLGLVAVCQGEADAARGMSEESVALFREERDIWGIALALSNLGRVAYEQGDLQAAGGAIEESLGLFREIGDMWGRGRALHTLGEVARLQGDYAKARTINEECLEVYTALDHKLGKAWALHHLAYTFLHAGDALHAAELFKESLSLYHEQGDKQGIAMCLVGLSGTRIAQPGMRSKHAAQLLGAAQTMFDAVGAYLWRADSMEYERCLAAAHRGMGEQAFEAALSEGRAMTTDQAVGLARESEGRSSTAAASEAGTGPTAGASLHTASPDAAGELTRRELEVLRLVAAGLSSAEVASRLFLSPHTVHAHLHSIYGKLGVTTRSAAAHMANSMGLL